MTIQTNEVVIAKTESEQLADTGERLLTATCDNNTLEHLHRYALALAFCKDKDVLDVASGEGYGSNLIAKVARSVRGVDISKDAVSHARAKYIKDNLKFIEGSASDIPLEAASVDMITSFETIEHHSQHTEMMREIKRVLRPGGLLVISSPDKLNYSDIPKWSNPFHVKELYKEEFNSLLSDHFHHVKMFGQRVVYGSLVVPETEAHGFIEYSGNYYDVSASDALRQPSYNVCLASDAPLPSLATSFYEGNEVLWKTIELEKSVVRKSLEAQRAQELELFARSPSFRIGRALTWPMRKLFRK